MFASENVEIIKFEKKENSNKISEIVSIHNKLKKIAKLEISDKNKFKIANLKPPILKKIQNLELETSLTLVAFEKDHSEEIKKIQLLKKINSLLDEYMNASKRDNLEIDGFSDFFAQ
jgi:hypothetical protein